VKPVFLPLLQLQRDLYTLPRGMERFREYIKTMTDAETGDLALPLVAMNPMGKDHIPALLDEYMALGADQIAAEAVERAGVEFPREFKLCLVVSDDLKGGWTNRWASEFSHRIESQAFLKRGFITGLLWTSEPPSASRVREAILTSLYRAEYLQSHPWPQTLREMLAQEGTVLARAGCTSPVLEADDLAYTRTVIEPHLDAHDRATVMACLFGDTAALALGYPPRGLSDRAGFAMALHDVQNAVRLVE
jgi:hypothetical protein